MRWSVRRVHYSVERGRSCRCLKIDPRPPTDWRLRAPNFFFVGGSDRNPVVRVIFFFFGSVLVHDLASFWSFCPFSGFSLFFSWGGGVGVFVTVESCRVFLLFVFFFFPCVSKFFLFCGAVLPCAGFVGRLVCCPSCSLRSVNALAFVFRRKAGETLKTEDTFFRCDA